MCIRRELEQSRVARAWTSRGCLCQKQWLSHKGRPVFTVSNGGHVAIDTSVNSFEIVYGKDLQRIHENAYYVKKKTIQEFQNAFRLNKLTFWLYFHNRIFWRGFIHGICGLNKIVTLVNKSIKYRPNAQGWVGIFLRSRNVNSFSLVFTRCPTLSRKLQPAACLLQVQASTWLATVLWEHIMGLVEDKLLLDLPIFVNCWITLLNPFHLCFSTVFFLHSLSLSHTHTHTRTEAANDGEQA